MAERREKDVEKETQKDREIVGKIQKKEKENESFLNCDCSNARSSPSLTKLIKSSS